MRTVESNVISFQRKIITSFVDCEIDLSDTRIMYARIHQAKFHSTAMRIIAVLLLATFAFSTVAEAAACSGEIQPEISHIASDMADDGHSEDTDNTGDTGDKHAVCAHGHCHHLAQVVTPFASAGAINLSVSLLGPRHDNALPEANLSKLKRPPRV